jgi:hypothetical protein
MASWIIELGGTLISTWVDPPTLCVILGVSSNEDSASRTELALRRNRKKKHSIMPGEFRA